MSTKDKEIHGIINQWKFYFNSSEKSSNKVKAQNRTPNKHTAEENIKAIQSSEISPDEYLVSGAKVFCSSSLDVGLTKMIKLTKEKQMTMKQPLHHGIDMPDSIAGKLNQNIGWSMLAGINSLQQDLPLYYTDTFFAPRFLVCAGTENKKCIPVIQNNEWKEFDKSVSYEEDGIKKFGLLKNNSFMICTAGKGVIYAIDNGQRVQEIIEFAETLMEIDETSIIDSGDLYIVTSSTGGRLRDDNHKVIEVLKTNRVLKLKNIETKEIDGNIFICVYYDDEKTGWIAESVVTKVDSSTEKYTVMYTDLTEDEIHVVGTIIGETLALSDKESKACAHTILNRKNSSYQWTDMSMVEICNPGEYHGADNDVYHEFSKYYKGGRNPAYIGEKGDAWLYEQKINAILPVIRGLEGDFTNNAVYFAKGKSYYHGKEVLENQGYEHRFFKHEKD